MGTNPTFVFENTVTKSLVISRLRKPLKTSTRLIGHGIWTRDLPNASLVHYHGATSLGKYFFSHASETIKKLESTHIQMPEQT